IVMNGHDRGAKIYKNYSAVGQTLALNGFVSLNIDAWGAGERGTEFGKFEYHGAKLGLSLIDIGESLMGMQLTDNIRGVDLLCSLPYVDADKIGATGASGGGNQTMWLAAMDERVKAAVPVVSVGSFESYVMRHNCVCEVLHEGLTFTEEDGVLALVAPRAIKICNSKFDSNPTFYPSEMLKTFNRVQPVFEMLGVKENIANQIFDLKHGYFPENRAAALGWFNLHLKNKGNGEPVKEKPFEAIDENELLVFPEKRDDKVIGTMTFRQMRMEALRDKLLNSTSIDVKKKRKELYGILKIDKQDVFKQAHIYGEEKGWTKTGIETTKGKIIPILHRKPRIGISKYVVVSHPAGKSSIFSSYIDELNKEGVGIVLLDLWGTGEASSPVADKFDTTLVSFHTLSRSSLWLGKTVMGEWVNELDIVSDYIKNKYKAKDITIEATKEAGLAALFLASLNQGISGLTLYNTPLSYQIDNRQSINSFNMAVHIPQILVWGDISLVAALSEADIKFVHPLNLSGQQIDDKQILSYQSEFEKLKRKTIKKGKVIFVDWGSI
ncbi:MAG TPA: prolyl oligopeptidase family serine peptidase, partial [Sphingobacterium sp.]|nr:prolyl oligopeptidase family serine peptidase [Sphingobacterium sp.]